MDNVYIGCFHVNRNGLLYIAVKNHAALVQHHAAGTQLADGAHVVADIQNRAAFLPGNIAHFAKAFLLELHITHGQNFIHYHDLAVQMSSYGKGQLDKHTAGIALDGGINKITALGKFNDLVDLGIDLGAGHAQNGAVHVDVLAAGHFVVEAGADFQHGSHTPAQADLAFGRGGNAGQNFEQGGFACTVAADNAQRFAFVHGQVHAVQRHKGFAKQAGIRANHGVGVLFAAYTGPPALQVMRQGAAADLTKLVLLF